MIYRRAFYGSGSLYTSSTNRRPNDKIHSQQLATKDAEIEKLRAGQLEFAKWAARKWFQAEIDDEGNQLSESQNWTQVYDDDSGVQYLSDSQVYELFLKETGRDKA